MTQKTKDIILGIFSALIIFSSVSYAFQYKKSGGKISDEKQNAQVQDIVKIISSSNLDDAIHLANLNQIDQWPSAGELPVEGHAVLGTEKKESITTVYTVSSYSWFGFENKIFTIVSGKFGVPTIITFLQNDKGEYVLKNYQEAGNDGDFHIFPKKYLNDVSHSEKFTSQISDQEKKQAEEYLKSIGRVGKVSMSSVEKTLPKFDSVDVSNKVSGILSKENMGNFPYWLGTSENIENGIRYVYETSQSKTSDGHDLMTYTKKTTDGKIVAVYRYQIVGTDVVLQ